MRPLFIAGCPRSGTSALTDYLNLHPEVMVAMERYNHRMLITPERLLDVRPEETRQPRERIAALIESKRWESLKWVGDKRPTYFLAYRELLRANPGARFVYIYRPLEEVVESFQEKHERPDGWAFTAHDAVRLWNVGLRRIRRFVGSGGEVLVADYHGFFHRPEEWATLLSRFLEVDFDRGLVEEWRRLTNAHDDERRAKRELTPEQSGLLRERDADAEAWALQRMESQLDF